METDMDVPRSPPTGQLTEMAKRLKLLSSIQPGYTLNVNKHTLVYRRGIYGKMTRMYYNEDRKKTLDFIEESIAYAIGSLTSEVSIYPQLREAKIGINNLKETYIHDAETIARIEKCLTRIENACTRFEHLLITSIEQIPLVQEMMQTMVDANEYTGIKLVRQTPSNNLTPAERTPYIITPNLTPSITANPTPNRSPSRSPAPVVSSSYGPSGPLTPPSTPSRAGSFSPPDSPSQEENSLPEGTKDYQGISTSRMNELYSMATTIRLPFGSLSLHRVNNPYYRMFHGVRGEDKRYLYPSFKPRSTPIIEDID